MEFPNWFKQTAQSNFEAILAPLAGKPGLSFLQVGAYTGDASLWMLENILTHEDSMLEDVDTWGGSEEPAHEDIDFKEVHRVYLEKVAPYADKVFPLQMTSKEYFNDVKSEVHDFIYIDGAHTASDVIDDAVNAWQMLKPGGIMAFDDYTWLHPDGEIATPKPAINFFVWAKQKELTVIVMNGQLWVRKNGNSEDTQG